MITANLIRNNLLISINKDDGVKQYLVGSISDGLSPNWWHWPGLIWSIREEARLTSE